MLFVLLLINYFHVILSHTLFQHCMRHLIIDQAKFQLALEQTLYSSRVCSSVSILFKMENTKKGGSVNRPPIIDGTNYDY